MAKILLIKTFRYKTFSQIMFLRMYFIIILSENDKFNITTIVLLTMLGHFYCFTLLNLNSYSQLVL